MPDKNIEGLYLCLERSNVFAEVWVLVNTEHSHFGHACTQLANFIRINKGEKSSGYEQNIEWLNVERW